METLPLFADDTPRTLIERLAQYFRRRPGVWIDGRVLATVAGYAAWRSRVSELRREPWNMRVVNRQRRVRVGDLAVYTVSEYCFLNEGGR